MQAKCREVSFVATFDDDGDLQCYQVPFSDTNRSYELIIDHLDEYDQFVQKEGFLVNVLAVLAKFEDEHFLHPLKSAKGTLKIELPRYKLTFSLNDNMEFESVEHKGYILSTNQQFDDFLPRFSRYLVLELQDKSDTSRPEVRMLLPVGPVVDLCEGMVDIGIPTETDSRVDMDQVTLNESSGKLVEHLTTLLSDVLSRRDEMEAYLRGAFATATSNKRDRLLALINFVPLLTMSDLVRCAFDDEALHTLVPKLSEESRERFKKGILRYMEICVLEDKVERLIRKAKRRDELSDTQLVEELMNVREWKSSEFPYWLAFEVEGRLQIRHEQFVVARHLMTALERFAS
ncbi:uncharacterized protein IUM83_06185 [Phytophthora cinnamomi]|uniref:uncharacterized protein n=1 Tax=Phytophthora cinnamomi TaxID=4785 RepID=UPI003559E8F7|nr:hypothetical protein IUM83_06185 [Phytophthora cinnamomi]